MNGLVPSLRDSIVMGLTPRVYVRGQYLPSLRDWDRDRDGFRIACVRAMPSVAAPLGSCKVASGGIGQSLSESPSSGLSTDIPCTIFRDATPPATTRRSSHRHRMGGVRVGSVLFC